jgi:hypothetical protein
MARHDLLKISVARQFSPDPGPRYARQGPNSGETFRRMLVRKLQEAETVEVDLDGTYGFGSSWLDEVFGGLIKYERMSTADVQRRVKVKSDADRSYLITVEEAIEMARPERAHAA